MAAEVFLFAHQDDEFGAYASIHNALRLGKRVLCIFFTDGTFNGQSSTRRNKESMRVLTRLGVPEENIHFLGGLFSIPDGRLHKYLDPAFSASVEILKASGQIDRLHILAWEGGHQDHDSVHVIGVALAVVLNVVERTVQFSLYNGAALHGPFFRVFAPLPDNGEVTRSKVPWADRLKYLRYCTWYRSQVKSWVGLFPFVLWHYLVSGEHRQQPINVRRLNESPHSGRPLYERRGFLSQQELFDELRPFLMRRLAPGQFFQKCHR